MTHRQDQCIFVAGHRGMVGSAIVRQLVKKGYRNILTASREELDLNDQHAVNDFFKLHRIDQVYLAAAKVGGIQANDNYPADFITDNLRIELNVIQAAHQSGVEKLLFLGSSCIYPKHTSQPIPEEALLSGRLEPTNEPYAIAKISGIKLCESYNRQHDRDYRSVMPTNLYGPGDNFHPENSHVIPGLMRRFHEATVRGAKEVVIWGSGSPRREFLYVDDMAQACIFVMEMSRETYRIHTLPLCSHLNVGTGKDCTIRELAKTLARVTRFEGQLVFDTTKPDGTPRKLLDVSRLNELGWAASTPLESGLRDTYEWYRKHKQNNERSDEDITLCH